MLTILFVVLFFSIFGKIASIAFRATWGLTKILFTFLFLPIILVGMVFSGLVLIAIPALVAIGIISLLKNGW